MVGSLAVGLPPDIQPILATFVGACDSATAGARRTIRRRNAIRLSLIVRLPLMSSAAQRAASWPTARRDLERDRYADAALDDTGLHQSVERGPDASLHGLGLSADAD